MFMPPPQHLLSPKERLSQSSTSTSTSTHSILPTFSKTFSTLALLLLLNLISLSAPSSSQHRATAGAAAATWPETTGAKFKFKSAAHWSIPEEEICPSARGWVVQPGSFCTTLWASPYLSNQTLLEARERRAVQLYCELDAILERFDCGQEYSVNVKRGQCQLCRQAYREWSCAVVADTQGSGSLDCDSKLMPCPSCASICHQVMRLCPYLSPDRMQFDLAGRSLPQVSQYGGHPAFYCPLENDDPSDPAYTSLCYKPFVEEDPDHVHNICTNPPTRGQQQNPTSGSTFTSSTFSQSRSRDFLRRRRKSDGGGGDSAYHHDHDYDPYTSPSSSFYGEEDEDSVTGWSSEFPLHYTTCCWTYASSLVIFDPSKDYPNYGSDAFFSTTLGVEETEEEEYGPVTRERDRERKLQLEKVVSAGNTTVRTPIKYSNVSSMGRSGTKISSTSTSTATKGGRSRNGSTTVSTSTSTLASTPKSTVTPTPKPTPTASVLPPEETNRVILNCCNSQGACNAVDGEEPEEKVGESSTQSPAVDVQELKSEPSKFIRNRKRSSERLGLGHPEDNHHQEEEEDEEESKLEGGGSGSNTDSLTSGSSSSSSGLFSAPSLFLKTIDLPSVSVNPTHISELEDLEYDEHYLDTEADGEGESFGPGGGGGSSQEVEESEEDEVEVEVESEVNLEKVGVGVKVKVRVNGTTTASSGSGSSGGGTTSAASAGAVAESESGESVHSGRKPVKKVKKDSFMSVVIQDSDEPGGVGVGGVMGVGPVLERDHHPAAAAAATGSVQGGESSAPQRTKPIELPLLDVEEVDDDESFTFVDNTNFLPGGSESDIRGGKKVSEKQGDYYYAGRSLTSASSSLKPSLFLFLVCCCFRLSLGQLKLSPTYLISAVFSFVGRRRMCLNSLGFLGLLLTFSTSTSTSVSGRLVASTVVLAAWICWSFLHKTNFRTRTRTLSPGSPAPKKSSSTSCVQLQPVERVSKGGVLILAPKSQLILSSAQGRGRDRGRGRVLRKHFCREKCWWSWSWSCWRRQATISSLRNHCYNSRAVSAWVQSSRVDLETLAPSLLLASSSSTTQIQDFVRGRVTRGRGRGRGRSRGHDLDGDISPKGFNFNSSGDRREEDDNNSSSRSLSGRRKRRRKWRKESFSKRRKVISCRGRSNFKIQIFSDEFLIESFPSFRGEAGLALQRWVGVGIVFNLNFKFFKTSRFKFTADADSNKDSDAPSKSLLNLNLPRLRRTRGTGRMLPLLLALTLEWMGGRFKFKYKLKLLRLAVINLNNVSTSNTYSNKIIGRRWKRKIVRKFKDLLPVTDDSSPSRKNEASWRTFKLNPFPRPPSLPGNSKHGHHSSSQCCRTDKLYKFSLKWLKILVKIEIAKLLLPPSNSITITRIKGRLTNSCNKFLVQFPPLVVAVATAKVNYYNLGQTLCISWFTCQNPENEDNPVILYFKLVKKFCPIFKSFSPSCKLEASVSRLTVADLHLLSLLLSLAKRCARPSARVVGKELKCKLQSILKIKLTLQSILNFTITLIHLQKCPLNLLQSLLLRLRGQSKAIELFDGYGGFAHPKSFKVYARETLKLLGQSDPRCKGQGQRSCNLPLPTISTVKKSWYPKETWDWCSYSSPQKVTAAGFEMEIEIHPLIKL